MSFVKEEVSGRWRDSVRKELRQIGHLEREVLRTLLKSTEEKPHRVSNCPNEAASPEVTYDIARFLHRGSGAGGIELYDRTKRVVIGEGLQWRTERFCQWVVPGRGEGHYCGNSCTVESSTSTADTPAFPDCQ